VRVMEKLIRDYDIELVEPPCIPGAPRWSAKAHLRRDIGDVLPYLNARLDDCRYNHEARVLVWKNGEHRYAFRPFEISAAPVEDNEEAKKVVSEVVSLVNRVWQERDSITPSFTEKELPKVLDIYRLLPQTNCKKCGYATCMAYAAALREGKASLDDCSPMTDPGHTEKREKLLELLSAGVEFGQEVTQ
jgi:ArsR family metal-binding transcriptional regulator